MLRPGVFTTLRLDVPQATSRRNAIPRSRRARSSQLFDRVPAVVRREQRAERELVEHGRRSECPDSASGSRTDGRRRCSARTRRSNPWRCVLTAPGISVGQVGRRSRSRPRTAQHQQQRVPAARLNCRGDCGNYDGKPSDPTGARQLARERRTSDDPRVVNLFIVPYQALQGRRAGRRRDPDPRLRLVLRHGLDGQNNSRERPLPRPDFERRSAVPAVADEGAIQGVFVETFDYEPGPVDETRDLHRGRMLDVCRPTLVR